MCYCQAQREPSLWLHQGNKHILNLQETLQQYEQLVQNLERVVQPEEGLHPSFRSQEGDEPPLQIILHNLYRYLMAVAANLDKLHEGVADARQAFLDKRKQVLYPCAYSMPHATWCPGLACSTDYSVHQA